MKRASLRQSSTSPPAVAVTHTLRLSSALRSRMRVPESGQVSDSPVAVAHPLCLPPPVLRNRAHVRRSQDGIVGRYNAASSDARRQPVIRRGDRLVSANGATSSAMILEALACRVGAPQRWPRLPALARCRRGADPRSAGLCPACRPGFQAGQVVGAGVPGGHKAHPCCPLLGDAVQRAGASPRIYVDNLMAVCHGPRRLAALAQRGN